MSKHVALTWLLIITLTICLLSGCQRKVHTTSRTDEVLGTIVSATVNGSMDEATLSSALDAAFLKAFELENIFSAHTLDSELAKVNESAYAAPVRISDALYTVLELSLYYAELSDGAFDPTLFDLIKLWGIGTEDAAIPDAKRLKNYVNRHNYKNVILDKSNQTVAFTNNEFSLDLGAIAKGYVADEMKRVLEEEYNIESAMLNLGGDIVTIGNKTDGSSWNIGIANPNNPTSSIASIEISNQTIVTSGNYERFFEEDGVLYHHILDGSTGYPANNGLIGTTIITDAAVISDALSTATYVSGLEASMALIESLDNVEAIFITNEGEILMTSGITEKVNILDSE